MKFIIRPSFSRRYNDALERAEVYRNARLASVRVMAPLMTPGEIEQQLFLACQLHVTAIARLYRIRRRWWDLPVWRRFFA